MSLVKAGFVLGFASLAAALPVGCSDDGSLPGATFDGGSGGGGGFGGVATGPCDTGDSRKCGIELAKHGDIVSCYVGTQTCSAGTWGECGEGSEVMKSISAPPGVGPASSPMNSLSGCPNNPCDPYCQNSNNDAGANADGGGQPIYTWQGGNIGSVPPGLVNKGIVQPCSGGLDCQFNMYCWHPSTTAACSHSKCETGGKLGWDCDPCVKEICKTSPSCCTYPETVATGGSCSHSLCSTGTKLAKGCDLAGEDCVTQICNSAGLAGCCQGNGIKWTAACVAAVSSVCGMSCPLSPAGTWTAACVNKVDSVCDAVCGTGSPPPEEGKCKEWIPGETDPNCAGVDLAVDVPCSGNIPVCNHGQAAAPAGIRLIHYPANSGGIPTCTPDQTHPQMYECFTTQPIPPGQCTTALQYWDGSAWVAGCDKLVGNREIMINPQVQTGKPTPVGYAGYVNECSCKDNWSIYSGGSCGLPTCGSDSQTAQFKKPNFLVMMDRTQSMLNSGIWAPAVAGLTGYFSAAGSAGVGIALEFFAVTNGGVFGDGCAPGNCNAVPCSNPMVPLGLLPGNAGGFAATLITALANGNPAGAGGSGYGTRIYPALDGALQWATAKLNTTPTERFDVILMTDGDPTDCNTSQANNAALAAAAYSAKGIKTYVIALPGSSLGFLNAIAAAGGTTSAINTTAGNMSNDMQAALNAITQGALSCQFAVPAINLYDPNDVTMTYTPSVGASVGLTKRANLAACNGNVNDGWYFDNNAAPTMIKLCAKSCTTAGNDSGSKVDVILGCPKSAGSAVQTIPYQSQCPAGTKPQWNFFAYDSTTPNTSTIDFRVRAADTQAGLASATWKPIATAQSTPTDTQVCALSPPAGSCPKDLFATLGNPDQKRAWLELEVTLTAGGGGSPVLNSFNATYSCPPSE
ncbi:MAG: VWA domain-containing protein [Myxococcales bacterium]|nr:VWA domain-containing protein [Myxococcales bacterium]